MGNKDPKPKKVPTPQSTPRSSSGTPTKTTPPPTKPSPEKANVNSSTKPKEDISVFSLQRLEALFDKYKDEDDQIGPNEMEKLCQDVGVDPEDPVMVVIAYHLKCKEMGYFQRDEFVKGFETLQCDTIDKIKMQIPRLKKELEDSTKFQAIYRFAFQFAKENEQKCIGIEIAQGLLNLLIVDRYPVAKSFIEYLKEQDQYKVVNADQWASLLEFCKAIQPDFSNYDENGAWPCILDEWVTWAKERKAN